MCSPVLHADRRLIREYRQQLNILMRKFFLFLFRMDQIDADPLSAQHERNENVITCRSIADEMRKIGNDDRLHLGKKPIHNSRFQLLLSFRFKFIGAMRR